MLSKRKKIKTPHRGTYLLRKFNIDVDLNAFKNVYESDSDIENLTSELENVKLEPQIKFVISTIAYVPERKFNSDSSDEEEDGTIDSKLFTFDINKREKYPYTLRSNRTKPRTKKLETLKVQEINKKQKVVDNHKLIMKVDARDTEQDQVSEVVNPFLLKLSENGFENPEVCGNNVSASLALNRMWSLSSRRNESLKLELKSKVETNIGFERFGFYWKCHWYNRDGKEVEYDEVRKYYKQLKRKDKKMSRNFLKIVESGVPVPYSELREYAKNSQCTRNLVKRMRTKYRDANIYLSLIDSDTVNFNGIYSAYLRIVNDCLKSCDSLPTVMSTGYEYPVDEKDGYVYKLASQVDMTIRTITAKYFPLGVYYPEPNMCVLIPPDLSTIAERFISQERSGSTFESPNLMKQLQSRSGFISKFVKDRAIITTIPKRAKMTRSHKTPIKFSYKFIQGASPSEKDVRLFKQVAQSHFHEKVWLDNLFVNGAIKLINKELVKYHTKDTAELEKCEYLLKTRKGTAEERLQKLIQLLQNNKVSKKIIDAVTNKGAFQHCKHLISAISNTENTRKRNSLLTEAKLYISNDILKCLCGAIEEISKYRSALQIHFVRSFDEEKLLKFIRNDKLKINDFNRKHIMRMSQSDVLELITDKKLDLRKISKLRDNTIEDLLDEKIVAHISLQESPDNHLIDIFQLLEANSLVLSDFGSNNILRMIQPDVYDLIGKELLDLKKMSKLNLVLSDLLNKEIIQAITDKCTDVDSIMFIFAILNEDLLNEKEIKPKYILQIAQEAMDLVKRSPYYIHGILQEDNDIVEQILDTEIIEGLRSKKLEFNGLLTLFKYIKECGLELKDFKRDLIWRTSQWDVVFLIMDKKINLKVLLKLSNDILEKLLDEKIVEQIDEDMVDADRMVVILELIKNNDLCIPEPSYILELAQMSVFDLLKNEVFYLNKIPGLDEKLLEILMNEEIVNAIEEAGYNKCLMCLLEIDPLQNFKRECILRFGDIVVLELIKSRIYDIIILSRLGGDILDRLLNEEVVQAVADGRIDVLRLIDILELLNEKDLLTNFKIQHVLRMAEDDVFDLIKLKILNLQKISKIDEIILEMLLDYKIVLMMKGVGYTNFLNIYFKTYIDTYFGIVMDSKWNFKPKHTQKMAHRHVFPLIETKVYNLNELMHLKDHILDRLLDPQMANAIKRDGTNVDNLIEILKLLEERDDVDEVQFLNCDELSQMAREDVYKLIKNRILDLNELVLIHGDVMKKLMHVDMIKEIEEIGYTNCLMKILGIDPSWNCKPERVREMAHRYNVGLVKRDIYDVKTLSELDNSKLYEQIDKDFTEFRRNISNEINPFQL